MKQIEERFESLFFTGRWLLAPFFFGLLVAIAALLVKFAKQLYGLIANLFTGSSQELIINILTLVDAALLSGLLLIIAFSGYENFVSKFSNSGHEDRPAWMGKVGFADLKLKLMGAIVAISAVELLKAFIETHSLSDRELAWKVGIHLTFVVSGVLFALTDLIADRAKSH